MQWLELTIKTDSRGLELLCTELTEAGFDSFAVEDREEFAEFLETSGDYWDYVDEELNEKMQGLSQVRLYLEAEGAVERLELLDRLLAELPKRYPHSEFGELTVTPENVPEEDWENSWKKWH